MEELLIVFVSLELGYIANYIAFIVVSSVKIIFKYHIVKKDFLNGCFKYVETADIEYF